MSDPTPLDVAMAQAVTDSAQSNSDSTHTSWALSANTLEQAIMSLNVWQLDVMNVLAAIIAVIEPPTE